MARWTAISDLHPQDPDKADQRLAEAWAAILRGKGTREDGEMVLTDLATKTGYFTVAPSSVSANELFMREGARTIFARIFFLLDVSMQKVGEMSDASLRQALDEEVN